MQTLLLRPLPSAPTHSWTNAEPESDSLVEISELNVTPERLFDLQLQHDALRAETIYPIISKAVARNRPRATGRTGFSSSIIFGLTQGSREYFTRLGVGTPLRYLYMVLDTGSDVVWVQCSPCKNCYSQSDPIFYPTKTRSFSGIPCGSPLCCSLDSSGCNKRRICIYQVSYDDGSVTFGDFSTETLMFRRTKLECVALGYGHDNEGLFVGATGLLSLGRGRLSFPTQAGRRFNRKFYYCLVDRSAFSKSSSMIFGDTAISRTTVFTPLLTNPKLDTFYCVELLGISVGGTCVREITPSLFKMDPAGNGGVIIDSGTKTSVKVPTVVLHFRGANVSLLATNYLIPVDSSGTFCYAFAGTMSGLSIIGNIQQQSFRVAFDSAGSQIGFAPRGCA
ncbi:hypothetical protein Goarm_016245 [Gossypium armourianum]|uniref:Peptidase A1 domain-containing protein n=1 Tax=Gossypium armourianum TaxID=34283 RepID=A0A7J9JCZ9_9ROSI|nr:hypothetical protein [Gossypium armourianum]